MKSLDKLDTQTLKYILKNAVLEKQEKAQNDFMTFVKQVWPEFVEGKHHKIYADKLNRILQVICFLHFIWGDILRLKSYKPHILGN